MKIIKYLTTCFLLCFLLCSYAQNNHSPVGLWKTLDDTTHKPKAIIQIWETPNKMLYGRILKVYPYPDYNPYEICTACKGARHNKRILGMVIMEHLTPTKNHAYEWDNGSILDPRDGNTYHCYIHLIENGQKLSVRGYIGLSLFGRSQTWIRVTNLREEHI